MTKRIREGTEKMREEARAIIILAAVEAEIQGLVDSMEVEESCCFLGETVHVAQHNGRRVVLATTGIGKVNAAIMTASLLQRYAVEAVWLTGCAGYYPEVDLAKGDVVITRDFLFGDEGVLTEDGPLSQREIRIPLLTLEGEPVFDELPASEYLHRSGLPCEIEGDHARINEAGRVEPSSEIPDAEEIYPDADPWRMEPGQPMSPDSWFQIRRGPSLTVSMASGDEATAQWRHDEFNAWTENMEGSAVAQTCARFGVGFAECRGISNVAGDRDKSNWRIAHAVRHAHAVLRTWLDQVTQNDRPLCQEMG